MSRLQALLAVAVLVTVKGPGLAAQESGIRLYEVAEEWGVTFEHHTGAAGHRYMVETMVGGVVMLDFDGDGDQDLFFVDGGALPDYQGEAPRPRLFRNDGGHFVDFTERSGLEQRSYGCGAVAADYDDDGDVDLLLSAFGANILWQNQGDGSFVEATAAAGLSDERWNGGVSFADVDRDGDLDLYVAAYVDFTLENHKFCGDKKAGLRGYCNPDSYNGLADTFYLNQGDGRFIDRTAESGLEGPTDAGLGVVFGDVDDDGWPDLYVANDSDPNLLFRNRGDGTFEDVSLLSGTSYGDSGLAEAGMGVDFGDVDRDGRLDLMVTNFELETNVLYKNLGGGLFTDARFASNVAEASLLMLSFGVDLADLDNDRDLDLVVANGHILDNAREFNERSRFAQPNQVLENLGGGRFRLLDSPGFDDVLVSRGLATGDLDGDGDLDVTILNSNGPAVVYENRGGGGNSWLQLDLVGRSSNSRGVGARAIVSVGGSRQLEEVRTASSYLSQNALTLHFGLGTVSSPAAPVRLELAWPSGLRQRFGLPPGTRVQVVESGRSLD